MFPRKSFFFCGFNNTNQKRFANNNAIAFKRKPSWMMMKVNKN